MRRGAKFLIGALSVAALIGTGLAAWTVVIQSNAEGVSDTLGVNVNGEVVIIDQGIKLVEENNTYKGDRELAFGIGAAEDDLHSSYFVQALDNTWYGQDPDSFDVYGRKVTLQAKVAFSDESKAEAWGALIALPARQEFSPAEWLAAGDAEGKEVDFNFSYVGKSLKAKINAINEAALAPQVKEDQINALIDSYKEISFTFTFELIKKEHETYTITWMNGETELEKDENVPYGTVPSYDGETPTKAATAQYTYEFSGWSPAVVEASADATYQAQFSETVREYTITWVIDGVSSTTNVAYGTVPTHDNPVKEEDADYTYEFAGWDVEPVAVTGEATYTAVFNAIPKTFTYTLNLGEHGAYAGDLEVSGAKAGDALPGAAEIVVDEYFEFAGWKFEGQGEFVTVVDGAGEYVAQYNDLRVAPTFEKGGLYADHASYSAVLTSDNSVVDLANPTVDLVGKEIKLSVASNSADWILDGYQLGYKEIGAENWIMSDTINGDYTFTIGNNFAHYIEPVMHEYVAPVEAPIFVNNLAHTNLTATLDGDPVNLVNADASWVGKTLALELSVEEGYHEFGATLNGSSTLSVEIESGATYTLANNALRIGTKENPLSAAEAIEFAEAVGAKENKLNFVNYIEGTATGVQYNSDYKSFTFYLDNTNFQAYSVKYQNSDILDSDFILEGEHVVVSGKLYKYNDEKYEVDYNDGTIVSVTRGTYDVTHIEDEYVHYTEQVPATIARKENLFVNFTIDDGKMIKEVEGLIYSGFENGVYTYCALNVSADVEFRIETQDIPTDLAAITLTASGLTEGKVEVGGQVTLTPTPDLLNFDLSGGFYVFEEGETLVSETDGVLTIGDTAGHVKVAFMCENNAQEVITSNYVEFDIVEASNDIEIAFSKSNFSAGVSSYTASFTYTEGDYTISFQNFNNNNKNWDYVKCGPKNANNSKAYITTTGFEFEVSSVVLNIGAIAKGTIDSVTLEISETADFSKNVTLVDTEENVTSTGDLSLDIPQANRFGSATKPAYYRITITTSNSTSTNGVCQLNGISFIG